MSGLIRKLHSKLHIFFETSPVDVLGMKTTGDLTMLSPINYTIVHLISI